MKRLRHPVARAAGSLCLMTLAACGSVPTDPLVVSQGTVIQNVTVVDTRDGNLLPGRAVWIDGGRIRRIVASKSVSATGSTQLIDGSGKYLVPGYLDMHSHVLAAVDQQPGVWGLLLAHGITGFRQMAGSAELIQTGNTLNADIAAGRIDAPEALQVAGDLVVGLPNPAAAVAFVRRQRAIGARIIKLVMASREVTLAILAEARVQGLDVTGHLPLSVTVSEASAAGWKAFEHAGAMPGILVDCSADEAAIRRSLLNGEGAKPLPFGPATILLPMMERELDAPFYQRIIDSQDAAKCQGINRALNTNGTWQVPTLIRLRAMLMASDASFRNDPALAYVDQKRLGLWQGLSKRFEATTSPQAITTFGNYYTMVQKLVLQQKRNGTRMLTGSDTGGIWVIPGHSLHQEFRELAHAGLTPLDVLQMATLNGAEFLGQQATMGTVDEGKNADLVLLDANPVADVTNLSRISGVLLKGRYLPRTTLDKMKTDVAKAYAPGG